MEEEAEKIIQQITEETDVEKKEIIQKIEKKQGELSGFITPEGAATIIARSYGITPEKEEPEVRKLLIDDLSDGMSNIDIVGKVTRIFEPREFERKNGGKGKVANLVIKDKTGEIRTVLWGKMADLVSEEEIQKGTPIRLEGAYVKKGRTNSPELNIGRRGKIEIDPIDERVEELPEVSDNKVKISELDPNNEYADVVGRVIAVTAAREFERPDKSVGKVSTLRIVDETGQCRVSLWGDKAEQVEDINQGDAVLLENSSIREWQNNPELHLNWRGRIVRNPRSEEIENLPEFEKKLLKIEEIEPDMPVLDLAAKVQRKFSPKEFDRDDGTKGKVMNLVLADETGTIRVSFWDEMVEIGEKVEPGDTILLENVRSATGLQDRPEIRVGKRTNIEINPEDIAIGKMKPRKIKLSEIEEGLDSIEVVGRVIDISDVREFTKSDESEGKVATVTLGDQTGSVEVTIWGDKTKILNELEKGDIIKVTDSYSVAGTYGGPEIHVSERSSIEVNPEIDEDIPTVEDIEEDLSEQSFMNIEEVEENSQVKVRGTIVRVFERRPVFSVCPNCGRNLGKDESDVLCEKCEEVVNPEYRAVINLIVDDGTENIRVVAFGELAEKLLGKSAEKISEGLEGESEISEIYDNLGLAGREIIVGGGVKRDDYFDQLELRAREIEVPDPIEETKKLLEKIGA